MARKRETRARLLGRDGDNQRALRREAYQRNHASRQKAQWRYAEINRERLLKYQRDRWAKNHEAMLAKRAEYRKNNTELLRTYSQRSYQKHREERLAKTRAYNERNREALKASAIIWYERNKGTPGFWTKRQNQAKECYYRNPFRTRASRFRHRYKATITAFDLWSLWKAQRGLCALTGEPLTSDAHLDHIVPLARGGKTEKANLRFLSPSANLIKRHFTDEELLDFCAAVLLTAGGPHPGS